ncbi:MAG: hypothetical protein GX165_01755 [Firmicutes bacterium]|nr:hypothetical protein [Bacillota bacterium]
MYDGYVQSRSSREALFLPCLAAAPGSPISLSFQVDPFDSMAEGDVNVSQERPSRQPKGSKRTRMGIILVVLLAFTVGFTLHYTSEEQKARRAVEAHLKAIGTGRGNPYETSSVPKVFVNVLDFRYLRTIRAERVPTRLLFTSIEGLRGDSPNSYEEYLAKFMTMFGDRAVRDGDRVPQDTTHYEFAFLYDLELTNRIGHRLYKKYVFEVRPSSLNRYGYKIVDFYEW